MSRIERWEALTRDLERIVRDCTVAGWDSYGAQPVTPEAIIRADRLLRALYTAGVDAPVGVVPTSRGGIAFEWDDTEVVVPAKYPVADRG